MSGLWGSLETATKDLQSLPSASVVGICYLASLFGALLFLLRHWSRLAYGFIEIAFAFASIVLAFEITRRGAFDASFSKDFDTFRFAIQLATLIGAAYLLAQGLSDIYEDRRRGPPGPPSDAH